MGRASSTMAVFCAGAGALGWVMVAGLVLPGSAAWAQVAAKAVKAATPLVLKGDTTCRPGDLDCNPCASDVRGQFSKLSMVGWREGTWTFERDQRYAPDERRAGDALRTSTTFEKYHIQGFVRTNSSEYPYAGTHSAEEPEKGSIFFVGKDGRLKAIDESRHHHPSGVAVLGDAIFVAEGKDVHWLRVSAAGQEQQQRWRVPDTDPAKVGLAKAGGGLGLAKLRDGTTLLVVTSPGSGFRATDLTEKAREDDALLRHTRLYHVEGNPAAPVDPGVTFLGEFEHPFGPGRCEADMEQSGELCYPKCPGGYRGVGPVCWQSCRSGYADDGVTCRKDPVITARSSYGRGVGKPLGCSSDEEKDGALCYPKCKAGYAGEGPVCWQRCPEGFRNDGAYCRKPEAYGRGTGHSKKKCEDQHGDGSCEKDGLLWYPKCRTGFHNVGCCVCSPNCTDGMNDIGVSCQKKSDPRGVGKALHACDSDEEKDGALCYPRCKTGYSGSGPLCWATCAAGFVNDGATCRKPGDIYAKKSATRGVGKILERKQPIAYSENLSLVTECSTGDLYTVHTTGTYGLVGSGFWRLSRIDGDAAAPRLTHIAIREQPQRERNCHHRSSATVTVSPAGKLEFLCSERNVQTETFNFLTSAP